jgi:hypothetical protein
LIEKDITGFKIAMDDATFMDISDCLYEGSKDVINLDEGKRARLKALGQSATSHVGSDQEETAFMFAELDEGENVVML